MSVLFFDSPLAGDGSVFTPNEDALKHITRVLRMRAGDKLRFTDGKGKLADAEIVYADKHDATVRILSTRMVERSSKRICIAISILKNDARFEWFVEKATELGVNEIVPLLCKRTEHSKFKQSRAEGILKSAMLQSLQSWIPVLHAPLNFDQFLSSHTASLKLIAHCEQSEKSDLAKTVDSNNADSVTILIGPEGDFSLAEIEAATAKGYHPVTLGNNRLRTETAAVKAAVLLTGHV